MEIIKNDWGRGKGKWDSFGLGEIWSHLSLSLFVSQSLVKEKKKRE